MYVIERDELDSGRLDGHVTYAHAAARSLRRGPLQQLLTSVAVDLRLLIMTV
jgi:hypothetical protein